MSQKICLFTLYYIAPLAHCSVNTGFIHSDAVRTDKFLHWVVPARQHRWIRGVGDSSSAIFKVPIDLNNEGAAQQQSNLCSQWGGTSLWGAWKKWKQEESQRFLSNHRTAESTNPFQQRDGWFPLFIGTFPMLRLLSLDLMKKKTHLFKTWKSLMKNSINKYAAMLHLNTVKYTNPLTTVFYKQQFAFIAALYCLSA